MSHASLRLAMKFCFTGLLSLCSTLAIADLKIQTRHSAMGHDSESTTYIKGARQRMEQGVASYRSVTIYQCDLKRMITINDAAKTYSITSIDVDPPAVQAPAGAAHRAANPKSERDEMEDADQPPDKGGSRVMTMASIDTTERQQMFGFTARHIRTLMAMDASDDACSKEEMMMETDGWYIDLQYPFHCSVKYRPPAPPVTRGEKPSCSDKFGMYTCYKGARKGFPLKEVTKIYTKEGQRMSMTQETVDLSNSVLDPKLFDIPAGYTEVQSMSAMGMGGMTREQAMQMARQQQAQGANDGSGPSNNGSSDSGGLLAGSKWKKSSGESTTASASAPGNAASSDASSSGGLLAGGKWKKSGGDSANASSPAAPAKQPGVARVGVLAVNNKSGQSASDMTQTLIDDLKSMQLDVVTLEGDAVADCKAKDCDYILSADIVALKSVSKQKVGGFFGKMIGQGEGSGAFEAVVAYKMFAPDGNTSKLDGTQNAREGTTAEESLGAVMRRVSAEVVKAIHK
jgi:hypothetical protein